MAGKRAKEKKSKGTEEIKEPVSRENQAKEHNKILRNVLIGIAILVAAIFLLMFISKSLSRFEYRGVEFEKVRICDTPPCIITYRTSLPVKTDSAGKNPVIVPASENNADYNFYFRKNVSFYCAKK